MIPGSDVTSAHSKVYPRHISGRFRRLRNAISLALQGLLFVAPWINWQGRQALLADIGGRKLYMMSLVLHPQDTYFLLLLTILAAMMLTFVSTLAGRMWCGFACPQTIFTQAFITVERWFEGDRAARQRLDKASWSPLKIRRKLGKWSVWALMSFWLGITFCGYFVPIRTLVPQLFNGSLDPGVLMAVAFFAGLAMFDYGYFREQFCWYVCPYARLQGVMLDADSLMVGYDALRGEPRGKLKDPSRGSCIDCRMCVQACPAGIDIRNGFQSECIACTACIDACDEVMDKIGQPRGLVRYTSLNALEVKPTQIIRPRLVVYWVVVLGLSGLLAHLLVQLPPLSVEAVRVVRPGAQLAATTADGRTSNVYRLQFVNRRTEPEQVWLQLEGLADAQLLGVESPLQLAGGQVLEAQVLVVVPASLGRGVHRFRFRAHNQRDFQSLSESTFFVP